MEHTKTFVGETAPRTYPELSRVTYNLGGKILSQVGGKDVTVSGLTLSGGKCEDGATAGNYDLKGFATGSTAVQDVYATEVDNTAPNQVTKTYKFIGWGENAGSTKDQVVTSITVNGHETVYAIWEEMKYTVTYSFDTQDNVTENLPDTNSFEAGTTVDVDTETDYTRLGYTFLGWARESKGDVITSFEMPNEAVTLFAVWKEKTISLTYFCNTNKDDERSKKVEAKAVTGKVAAVATLGFSNDGYVFDYWYTNQENDGTGIAYNEGASVRGLENDSALYAQWRTIGVKPTYVTVNYYMNDGSISGLYAETIVSGVGYVVKNIGDTGLTREGYTFKGWNTESDGTGTPYAVDANITSLSTNVTLYAQWEKIEPPAPSIVEITYYRNQHRSDKTSKTIEIHVGIDKILAASDLEFSYNGYDFVGWNTQADGSGTAYSEGTNTNNLTQDITLYAIWEEIKKDTSEESVNESSFVTVVTATIPTSESENKSEEQKPIANDVEDLSMDSEIEIEEEEYKSEVKYMIKHIYYAMREGELVEVDAQEEILPEGSEINPIEKEGFDYRADETEMVYNETDRTYDVTLKYYQKAEPRVISVDDVVDTGAPLVVLVIFTFIAAIGLIAFRIRARKE